MSPKYTRVPIQASQVRRKVADARMRDAAPELAAALLAMVEFLECNYDHNDVAMQHADTARAALAKAGL